MLRTLASVTRPNRTELNVVTGWARGIGARAVPHPSLYHIALLQRGPAGPLIGPAVGAAGGVPQQRLSHWFRGGAGAWTRMSLTTVGPSESFTL